jgi:hypothetical protein
VTLTRLGEFKDERYMTFSKQYFAIIFLNFCRSAIKNQKKSKIKKLKILSSMNKCGKKRTLVCYW